MIVLPQVRSQGRGELLVSLCHQPAANRLTVVVLKARNLPKMDITGLSGERGGAGRSDEKTGKRMDSESGQERDSKEWTGLGR